jgi:hypothetical protein
MLYLATQNTDAFDTAYFDDGRDRVVHSFCYAIDTDLSSPVFFIGILPEKTGNTLKSYQNMEQMQPDIDDFTSILIDFDHDYIPEDIQKMILQNKLENLA